MGTGVREMWIHLVFRKRDDRVFGGRELTVDDGVLCTSG